MGKKLHPKEMELYKRIDEILFYKWDPIGVSDSGWGRDEYQSYLPQVFKMALEYNEPEKIAEYLGVVTSENMGLPRGTGNDLVISKLILEVKEAVGLE